MAYQKKISKSQQEKWFAKINNKYNYYFLIYVKNQPIGVINCKEVDEKARIGEGGIFIWDKDMRKTPYPVFASLILLDFIFNELQFGEYSFIRVLQSNRQAIRYNKALGYQLVPWEKEQFHQGYVLHKSVYNRKAKRLRRAAEIYTGSSVPLRCIGEQSDQNLDVINAYIRKLG